MANHSRVRDISMVGAKEEYVPREILCDLTLPPNVRAPMYVNPFFFLTASFAPPKQLYPAWITSAAVFVLMGAIALTLRNLCRKGD